ncbi:MAG: tetratricopeptide repeat protein [Bacteroidota bacterium]
MARLIIRHLPESEPAGFLVLADDGRSTRKPATVTPPEAISLPGDRDLSEELRWYLERFLDYPFDPATEKAKDVLAALEQWGRDAFTALFGTSDGLRMYDRAVRDGLQTLHLEISSDDARILSWPWEALYDPERQYVAHTCQVGRRLNRSVEPPPLSPDLPTDRVHILLVTARPYDNDVAYRSISRALVETVQEQSFPATVDVLRPPTVEALRNHLRARPNQYHILHFDGHGGYGAVPEQNGFTLRGPQGRLVFEDDAGKESHLDASELSTLLQEHGVPVVVLNACQSAMVDGKAEDAFASVAAACLRGDVRSVVAMGYSLYVSGAQVFLPAFYRRLFEVGHIAEAVRAGRRAMYFDRGRLSARGRFPLSDWLVPVVYEDNPPDFTFVTDSTNDISVPRVALPEDFDDGENPYGFIGRDRAILELERAMRRPPASILVHGLGGIGKTTLVRGFVKWLHDTGGLGTGALWFHFGEIQSAEYVFNRIGEQLCGPEFATVDLEKKPGLLAQVLNETPLVLVWDNFESAFGAKGNSAVGLLPEEDRGLLKELLARLRGGKTKVLVTSRSAELWLERTHCFRLQLDGLHGEERWEFCEAIIQDLGLNVDRDDKNLMALLERLEGHPLMMRVVLTRLGERSAVELSTALSEDLDALERSEVGAQAKLFATLQFVEDGLEKRLCALLDGVAQFEGFVDASYLEAMAKQIEAPFDRVDVDQLFAALSYAGLVQDRGHGVMQLHPMLTSYIRTRHVQPDGEAVEPWKRAFVQVIAQSVGRLEGKPTHQQRDFLSINESNLVRAQDEAVQLNDVNAATQILSLLVDFALSQRHLSVSDKWCRKILQIENQSGSRSARAKAYLQMGMVEYEKRRFVKALDLYKKSIRLSRDRLWIRDKENKNVVASAYHQMGLIAEGRRDFARAGQWYHKSLNVKKEQGDSIGAALTYHHLGVIAQYQRDFAQAEQWYRKALAIREDQGDEGKTAETFHQLGIVAGMQGNYVNAERWYRSALVIFERHGNQRGAAMAYHQLGLIAQHGSDFVQAQRWYLKAVEIAERQGDESGAATTYHQLGRVAEEREEFAIAEKWYYKALSSFQHLQEGNGIATVYAQLGILNETQKRWVAAGRFLVEATILFSHLNDGYLAGRTTTDFLDVFYQAPEGDQATLRILWEGAGLPPLPDDT